MRKGIFSGTFNPVHFGHLIMAECVRDALKLDKVIFLPLAKPWNKPDQDLASIEDRFSMLMAAIKTNPAFSLSRVEIDSPRPRYDSDLLKKVCGDGDEASDFFCILGSDALAGLPHWQHIDELLQLMKFVVVDRPGHDTREVLRAVEASLPSAEDRFHIVESPPIAISSTDLRRRASAGLSLRYRVPDSVATYIARNGLYTDTPTSCAPSDSEC